MLTINIAKDFTHTPGARNYSDGPYSGEEFYDKLLRSAYESAIAASQKLKVILDGTEGYASSFLNEAFSLLGNDFGAENVLSNLVIVSNEVPKYIAKVIESVKEKRSRRRQLAAAL